MSERLTRKEIKHDIRDDEVQHVLHRVLDFLVNRPKVIGGVLAGFVALVLAATGLFAYLDRRAEAANEQLAEAMKIAGAPLDGEIDATADPDGPRFASAEERRAETKRAFEEVRGGVGSSVAGEVADLYLANIAASEGDAETARKIWQSFLDKHSGHALAVGVRVNLIHLDRETGRAQELADELQRELDGDRRTLPEDVLLFELARTYEALGQEEDAVDAYRRILDEHPRSPYAQEARQKTTAAG